MQFLSEYCSNDETKKAVVLNLDGTPVVEFYLNETKLETRSMANNTFQYAEDAAENYVMGILKIN